MTVNKSVNPCDYKRLNRQLDRVRSYMLKSAWRTLEQISKATKAPECSVSRRLREVRAEGFRLEVKRVKGCPGLHVYRVFR